MKMRPECVPCLIGRVLYETNLVEPKFAYRTIRASAKILSEEFKEGVNSAEVATKVHKKAYEILSTDDPYKEVKKASNNVALRLFSKAKNFVQNSKDKLKASMICAIAGNVLDFGIRQDFKSPEMLLEIFDKICAEGLEYDDTEKVRKILEKSEDVLFFADNCGEIVFDKLLLRELKRYKINLTLVVRKEPILTDATIKDIRELGIDRLGDDVLTTGAYAVGVNFQKIPKRLKHKLETTDLIVCKGMANYESFSDTTYRPIAYLLRTKCKPVADDMHLKKDISAVKLYE